jgi:hypothetical protein
MRYFDKLIGEYLKKKEKQTLPIPQKPSLLFQYRFRFLADALGFATKEIKILKQKNPDAKIAYTVLLEARDTNYFIYDKKLVLRYCYERTRDQGP